MTRADFTTDNDATTGPVRIAMWSGPRNISTALMRSWGNRPDTIICDEPLYAHYLLQTGLDHPGAEEVINHHETNVDAVIAGLLADLPEGKTIFYQKHMAHHLLPTLRRDWLGRLCNCFLIREPREMLTSLLKILPTPRLVDTGLPQQVEIFEQIRKETGKSPPVLDSKDVLDNPRGTLGAFCESIGVSFREEMLSWPKGSRPTDGIWAKHWYDAVDRSTGFQPYRPKPEVVPPRLHNVLAESEQLYGKLYTHRLVAPV